MDGHPPYPPSRLLTGGAQATYHASRGSAPRPAFFVKDRHADRKPRRRPTPHHVPRNDAP